MDLRELRRIQLLLEHMQRCLWPVTLSSHDDFEEISPDGRALLFTGLNKPGGYGLGDIHVSRLGITGFQPAENLVDCVNTAADEYHPTVLWCERKLVFAKATYAAGESGDFYIADLPLPP